MAAPPVSALNLGAFLPGSVSSGILFFPSASFAFRFYFPEEVEFYPFKS
jgi:hypothetical protein